MIRTYVSVNLELKYEYVILLMQCSIKVFYILAIHVTHWGLWKKKSLNTDLADKWKTFKDLFAAYLKHVEGKKILQY